MRRRGETWQLRVYAGIDPATGRKRYVSRSVRGGKRAARRELDRLTAEVNSGQGPGTEATLSELLARWQEAVSADWSPTTRRQTTSAIRVHIEPLLGSHKLSRLSTSDLDRFYAQLRKKPGRKGKYLSPATIRRVHGIVRLALQQAVKWGWIGSNPADAASPPKVRPPQIKPPSADDVSRVLAMVKNEDPDLFTYLRLAASTGARRSQLCALRWPDIELDTARITFARAVVDGDEGIAIKGTKTDRVYRVTADQATMAALSDHRAISMRRAEACGASLRADAFVFSYVADGSSPWRPDGVSKRWTRVRTRAGLEDVRLHDLRHFMATTMLTAGVPVSVVAGRLGHARAATTLNVYSHFVEAGDQAAAETMGDILADSSQVDGQRMDSDTEGKAEARSEDRA